MGSEEERPKLGLAVEKLVRAGQVKVNLGG
jgi:hypothetical protein